MTKTIFGFLPIENSCLYNRIALPTKHAKPTNINLLLGGELPHKGKGIEALMFHGLGDLYGGVIEILRLKLRNKKFVWTIDDDYLSIPDWNGNVLTEDYKEFHEMCVGLADTIIVSTEALKSTFKRKNVVVAPNLAAQFINPNIEKKNGKIKILWQGSTTHKKDVEIIEPALLEILNKYSDKVEVVFWGDFPPNSLYTKFAYSGLSVQPQTSILKYYQTLFDINPDIMLAPLVDCHFNRCKSNLRILDGWSCKAAVIASGVGEYNCINNSDDGLLCTTSEDFYNSLEAVINCNEVRTALQTNGYNRVKKDYNWLNPDNVKGWNNVFEGIFNV